MTALIFHIVSFYIILYQLYIVKMSSIIFILIKIKTMSVLYSVPCTEQDMIEQKGMLLNHDFYVGKQCRTENAQTGHQYIMFI